MVKCPYCDEEITSLTHLVSEGYTAYDVVSGNIVEEEINLQEFIDSTNVYHCPICYMYLFDYISESDLKKLYDGTLTQEEFDKYV